MAMTRRLRVASRWLAGHRNGVSVADTETLFSVEAGFKSDKNIGPDLAADRAARVAALLEKYGAVDKNDVSANPVNAKAIMEMIEANSAMTQEAWIEQRIREGRLDPGALFSREA